MKNVLTIFLALTIEQLWGQMLIELPEESQHAEVRQVVGFTELKIEYSRPNVNGRELFGNMIPYGSVWRTGANDNTKISLSQDIFIDGTRLMKGTYALYTIPEEKNWTVIINSDTSLWGHYGYRDSLDIMRFKVPTVKSKEFKETFMISFQNINQFGGHIDLEFGDLKITIPFKIDWDHQNKEILAEIDSVMSLPDDRDKPIFVAHDYLRAARYYYDNGKDQEQSLAWINKAIDLKLVSYFPLYKAEILAKMGRYDEAIEASQQGLEIFMRTGSNKEWIWRYNQQIVRWNELKKGK